MTFSFSIKNYFLVLTACIGLMPLVSFSGKAQHGSRIAANRMADDSMNADILYYVNQYRQSKGLPPLQMNPVVSAEATKHSSDMALQKTAFGHEGFDIRIRMIVQQLGPMHRSAENVAFGNLSAKEVVNGWLNSPGHRKNIEGDYTITGIGTATSREGMVYFTQIFTAK